MRSRRSIRPQIAQPILVYGPFRPTTQLDLFRKALRCTATGPRFYGRSQSLNPATFSVAWLARTANEDCSAVDSDLSAQSNRSLLTQFHGDKTHNRPVSNCPAAHRAALG